MHNWTNNLVSWFACLFDCHTTNVCPMIQNDNRNENADIYREIHALEQRTKSPYHAVSSKNIKLLNWHLNE